MSETDLKNFKNLNIDAGVAEMNINELDDDSLQHIFEYLSLEEKLLSESVCKRWNLVCKLSWNHVTSLKVDQAFEKKFLGENKTRNTALIIQVLHRCGNYLTKLSFNGSVKNLNWLIIMQESANILKNITELELDDIENVSTETFKLLFENNKNLKIVSLINLNFDASSLMSLNPDLIEVFILADYSFYFLEDMKSLLNFLSHLKNIKILEIHSDDPDLNFIIDALNSGNIVSIIEFKLMSYEEDYDKLSELLKRQKQLRKLHLHAIPELLINSVLSLDHLEEIQLYELNDEFLKNLCFFKNLKSLSGRSYKFTDKCLQNVSKCVSLKKIDFEVVRYDISIVGVIYFSQLENLESLKLEIWEGMGDLNRKSLLAFSKCKMLKEIIFGGVTFEYEIEEFDCFDNLEKFEIWESNITNEVLAKIILKSPKLKNCIIRVCEKISNKFIDLVNDIKTNINNNHVLNVEFFKINVEKNYLANVSPLLSLHFNNFLGMKSRFISINVEPKTPMQFFEMAG